MFAGLLAGVLRARKRLGGHKYGTITLIEYAEETIRWEFHGILDLLLPLSSPSALQNGEFFPYFVKSIFRIGAEFPGENPTKSIAKT
jgi:hypothetical protein